VPLIRDGKLRALAVSSSSRLAALPDIPPFAEAAGAPEYEVVSWHVLLAPAATPTEIVEKLRQEMKRIMAAPDMSKRISELGLIPIETPTVDGIRDYIKSEQEKWGSLVRKLGLEGSQ
jgi:tripartite-type tricarboxylate transporter receptor subunit TctC